MSFITVFLRMACAYPIELLIGSTALLLGGVINLVAPWVLRSLVDRSGGWLVVDFYSCCWILLLLIVCQGVSLYFRITRFAKIGHFVAVDLRRRLFTLLINRPVPFFDQQRSTDLVNRLSADIQLIQAAIGTQLSVVLRYSLQVLGGSLLMVFVSPELTVLIVLIFPLLIAVSMLFVKRLRALTKAQQAALAGSSRLAEEAFVGIKIVKAFNAEGDWIRQFSQSIEEVAKYGLKRTVVSSFFQSVVTALLNIILLSILVIALYLLSIARITSQDLVAFVMYGTIVTVSFSFLVGSFSELAQAAGAFERVSEFEALPSFKCGFPSQILTKEQPKELGQLTSVELQEISFSYPARVDLPVLTKINLKIRAGQTVALVGPSGSGKSAIAQLVMGFYQPSQGVVLINGQIANSAELLGAAPLKGCSSFYGEIGYVPQDALLFSGSIADNLRLGSHLIEDSQLWEACRLVNMADFISNLPSGLDTDLGQLGAHLSGGQRQRLAITRALVRRPRLLILDEATSGLDLENEAIVLSNLRSFQEDALILLISHRYSSVRSCDYVYVLSDGRMIEEGVASQLYGQDTVFRYLMSDS